MMRKYQTVIIAILLSALFCATFIGSPMIGYFAFLANGGDEGLATVPIAHVCSWKCPECGKCMDPDCTEAICAEKCQGHVTPHECESKCVDCGKCLDSDCTEDACKAKCGDDENMTPYTFEAEDSHVILAGGVSGSQNRDLTVNEEGGYVGQFDGTNTGATITYQIISPAATRATLQISMSMRATSRGFNEYLEARINDVPLETPAIIPGSDEGVDEWTTFATVTLGCIRLNEGINKIQFTVTSTYTNAGGNFDKIVIKSTEQLSWPLHQCESVCVVCGGCENTACQELACQNKCKGHVSSEATEYVFEAEDSNREGWHPTEMSIVEKANASGGKRVGGCGNIPVAGQGYYFLFEAYAKEECAAFLNFGLGSNVEAAVSSILPTSINGEYMKTGAQIMKYGWEEYTKFPIATVKLKAGKNVIKIDIGNGALVNFDYISLLSDVELSATEFST